MSKKHQRCRFIWYIITWYYDNKKLFQLESLYSTAFTVDGTRSHHSFVPQGNGSLIMNVFPLIGAMTNMNFTTSIYTITASTKKLVEMSLVSVMVVCWNYSWCWNKNQECNIKFMKWMKLMKLKFTLDFRYSFPFLLGDI